MLHSLLFVLCVAQPPKADVKQAPVAQVALALSHDGSLGATCGDKVRVFEFESGKLIHEIDAPKTRSVAFSPASKNVLAVGADNGVVRVYDLNKPDKPQELLGHEGFVTSLTFDPAGKLLATSSTRPGNADRNIEQFGQFRLWDVTTGAKTREVDVKNAGINGVRFSPDGKHLVLCKNGKGDGAATTAEVYTVAAWERVAAVTLSAGALKGNPFGSVARFFPDGKRLLIGGGVCVPLSPAESAPYKFSCRVTGLLWSVELGDTPAAKLVGEPRLGYYENMSLSSDGKRLVSPSELLPHVGGTRVELREADTGKVVWHTGGTGEVHGIQFTPDGKWVTSMRYAFLGVHVYDATTGKHVRTIELKK